MLVRANVRAPLQRAALSGARTPRIPARSSALESKPVVNAWPNVPRSREPPATGEGRRPTSA
eukprot:6263448-Pyramimonas_sp.AAC.1